ncbi:hypothetical protein Tsubulata_040974 [Turnera subulata]|uniref:Squalene cyclase N-terminal domain-containing protein n=1 Tax=Turnera subulata TaxID=218843 RepID=A0A9Q0JG68_9ROSI|nr:hypothetical protein Tsubulata_040974 [Turnera subulata]
MHVCKKFAREKKLEILKLRRLPSVKVRRDVEITVEVVDNIVRKALGFHSTLQAEDGFWPGDYGGPLFLLPGLNEDGGWGIHIEGHSTMLGTVLSYAALRLMGEEINGGDGTMVNARNWILNHGGATSTPSWGKLWLSVTVTYPFFFFL